MKYLGIITILFSVSTLGFTATLDVPGGYATIQLALDAASNGDTVLVAPGTYVENIDFLGKAVLLKSTQGAADTVIDGNQTGSVVSFVNMEGLDTILEGFTITNGTGTESSLGSGIYFGGGLYVSGGIGPTLLNNCICNNEVIGSGGGIYLAKSSAVLTGNEIVGNKAEFGGGVSCFRSAPSFKENIISYNQADQNGGGIIWERGRNSPYVIHGNLIAENEAGNLGGGIMFRFVETNLQKDITLTANTFSRNIAQGWGGGGVCFYKCVLDNVTVAGNIFQENSSNGVGGGLYFYHGIFDELFLIRENDFVKNEAESGAGIGFTSSFVAHCEIWNNRFNENRAGHYGGGIYSSTIMNCASNLFRGNRAGKYGGGICTSRSLDSLNNIYCTNTAVLGGGIYIGSHISNECDFSHETFYANSATVKGGAIYFDIMDKVTISNSILWENHAPIAPACYIMGNHSLSIFYINHSDVQGGRTSVVHESLGMFYWDNSVIDIDPLFVDSVHGDFHLVWGSPCRDTGLAGVGYDYPDDFEGDSRSASVHPDMGADEFHGHLYHTGHAITPGGMVDLKIVDVPGSGSTKVFLSMALLSVPLSTLQGDWYLAQSISGPFDLGQIPASGVLILSIRIPPVPAAPYEIYLQALLSNNKLSNLETVKIR